MFATFRGDAVGLGDVIAENIAGYEKQNYEETFFLFTAAGLTLVCQQSETRRHVGGHNQAPLLPQIHVCFAA